MSEALLLLPNFVLIARGFLICRYTALGRPVWDGAERLVYVLLFPALLFSAIVRNPIALGAALPLAGCAVAVVAVGVVPAFALRALPAVDPRLHASGAQTAFRFNSYVALALSERLGGTPAWPGWRWWCRCPSRCATWPPGGRWRARVGMATLANCYATR